MTLRCFARVMIVALVMVWGVQGEAKAEPKRGATAVLPFTGKNGSKVRQRVQSKLNRSGRNMVSLRKVSSAYRKTKRYSRLAKTLKATVFVKGKVSRVKKRWVLDIEVRNKRGKRLKRFRISSSRYTRMADRAAVKLKNLGLLPKKRSSDQEPIVWEKSKDETGPAADSGAATKLSASDTTKTRKATPGRARMVIRPFKGKGGSKMRVGVVRALQKREVELVSNGRFVKKAKELDVRLSNIDGHILPAGALKVNALVEGDIERDANRWTAYIRVIDGRSTKVIDQQYYEARTSTALVRAVEKSILEKFGDEIVALAPRADGTSVAETRADRRDRRKARRYGAALPPAFDISLGGRVIRRTLKYNQDIRGDLRGYTLNAAPGIGLRLRWYPGAHFVSNWPAHFGIDIEYERIFDFNSTRQDGVEFPSESKSFGVGLRWRYPHKWLQPSAIVGYGAHSFAVLIAGPATPGVDNTPLVPQVKYRFIRLGGELRMDIKWFKVIVNAAYLFVFDTGGISSKIWFPRDKAGGMEAGLLLGFGLPAGFEIRGGIDYRRYFHDLRPDSNNNPPWVAGGALDQYLGFSLGLAWRN